MSLFITFSKYKYFTILLVFDKICFFYNLFSLENICRQRMTAFKRVMFIDLNTKTLKYMLKVEKKEK